MSPAGMVGSVGGNDEAVLRICLVCLAAGIVFTGICTHSWKKMAATYCFWMFALSGILLPDWEFFRRPISQWGSPVVTTVSVSQTQQHNNNTAPADQDAPPRCGFKLYPVRLLVYAAVYSYGFHKWWSFITS